MAATPTPEPKVFRSPASPGYVPLNAASPLAPDEPAALDVPDVDEKIGGALLRQPSTDVDSRIDDDPFKAYEEAAGAAELADTASASHGEEPEVDEQRDDDAHDANDDPDAEQDEDPADAPAFVKSAERKERLGHAMKIVMMVAAGVMVPVLLLQSIYYWRNQLAVTAPPLRPMLNGMCAAFHCTVGLPAQIEKLTLESNELQVVPPNQNIYALALVLRNRSGEPQAWPHIELTLNNDDEKPVVRRVFRPREYLATPQLVDAGIAGESEQQVKLTFELSDALVSGYRIYLFYP